MSWLALLNLGLKFVNWIAEIVHNRELMDAGEAKAIAKGATDALETIRKAQEATAAVKPLSRDELRGTDGDRG